MTLLNDVVECIKRTKKKQAPNKLAILHSEENPLIYKSVLLGVEIEAENPETLNIEQKEIWYQVGDGSLKINGKEFIFRRPVASKDIFYCLKLIEPNLKNALFNIRTGFHVHTDVTRLESLKILSIILHSYLCESLLFQFKQERYASPFCTPITDMLSIDNFFNLLKLDHGAIFVNTKYISINVRTISTKGSIEYRLFPATNNINDYIDYINAVLCIRKYATNKKTLTELKKGYLIGDGNLYDIVNIFKYCPKIYKFMKEKALTDNNLKLNYIYIRLTLDRLLKGE